jgi:23S rRNA (uridine2552-2'-O)-methyltransferase
MSTKSLNRLETAVVNKGGASTSGTGHRGLKTKVKSGRKKASSRQWLERQLNDPYVARAKHDGYRSRAAYKLLEIDARYGLIKRGMRVVDLGAAPGGWSQVAAAKTGSSAARPLVVAVDYLGMAPLAGVTVLEKDFLDADAPDLLREALGGEKADLVLSDMAAPATGHKRTDHLRIIGLCEAAADFRRHRTQIAGRSQTRFHQSRPCQTAGQPARQRRTLSAGDGLSRRRCALTIPNPQNA